MELLCRCFTTLYCSKVSIGSPTMPQEVKEAKMAWVQLQTKCKCTTSSLDEDNEDEEDEEEGDIVEEEAQGEEDLLGCASFESSAKKKKEEVLITQTMSSKKVININTDEDNSDMSVFEPPKEKRRL
eukprot:12563186-Ditylum_brightwellii.AAC.1